MKYLAIDKHPYFIAYALFDYETKALKKYGKVFFTKKDEGERVTEIYDKLTALIDELKPRGILTHWIDLSHTMKRDLIHITQIKTFLRFICNKKNMTYNEFRTYGWEMRITGMQRPSKKAKLDIVHEYDPSIESTEEANAIVLGEGVVWNRLQIGKD